MISVHLLGGARLRSGDAPVGGPPAQRHRIALLTLVVAAWPRALARDRAMALLWPERDLASARRLLNLAVHVLRATLGEGTIVTAHDGLLLDPTALDCDLHALRTAIAAGAHDEVLRLYAGPLLDGFHLPESAEFDFWLDTRRAELAHAYVDALRAIAERQGREGDVHGRAATLRRLAAAEPHSAAHALALMEALDAAGDRAGAIAHAGAHARRLREDLDLDPDHAVTALADRLRRAPATRATTAHAARDGRVPSVAVLPFLALSAEPEHERFADGFTEDVIAQLSKIRALDVIARASVAPFKTRPASLKSLAATLGATTLLDGTVRHAGDRVRIVAKLVDARTEQHLWAETYDRDVTDVFAIQTDVALHIAAALKAELSRDEQARVRREPTRDMHAHSLFLRGRQWFTEYTPDALARAIECFDRAFARDPTFALACASLATACTELVEHGAVAPDVAYRRAAAAAEAALRLDPELGPAHCAMAYLKMVRDFDWPGAEHDFRRALELGPGHADAHELYGRLCAALERYDEALALLQRAQTLDPLAHRADVATLLLRAGRYEEAVRHAENAVELDPAHDRARATLGWAYFLGGRRDEGLAELRQAVALAPGNTLWLGQLGAAQGMNGDAAAAEAIVGELQARARTAYVSPYHVAYVHSGLGDAGRAMDWLERAVAERAGGVYGIRGSFLFASLRGEPRFEALLRRMNLA
ncbi:transcriptional activator domain-containing protein (plasmid) [Gemmatirosa kalamazoonensis]|uniref:Transcriptional activator domain-containing protein n=1 Tax=Gemmatirosa kalamazoonensis TaxID=861299 RepID=W0RRQ9_9BACT|nr:tetratricopeptide repeat protein [Gemmatirosa kalamazoonensis]AHG93381.1 transcriptional activator domain-containing protein [Gemmatirosa kalamazoonensis]